MLWQQKLAFGVGHVLNDLCASIWFSYLIVFFNKVLLFENTMAGHLLLLGQVVDAVSTTLVGWESDRTKGCGRYGRHKSWHLLGTICVVISFPFIFNNCFLCEKSSAWAKFAYFAPFISIFQFGWAAVQVNHLALLPSLSADPLVRVGLNSTRFIFTVLSNMMVFLVTFGLLALENGGDTDTLAPHDQIVFRNLGFIVVATGVLFSTFFHVVVIEPPSKAHLDDLSTCNVQESSSPHESRSNVNQRMIHPKSESDSLLISKKFKFMRWKDWFLEPQFYQVALLYMCTRLIFNVSQVYQANYLSDTLNLHKIHLALFPLTVYMASFLSSFFIKKLNQLVGRKFAYLLGLILCSCFALWVNFLADNPQLWQVYCMAVLLGVSLSFLLVTSLSVVCDLIGSNTETSAFVYGCMSFMDKISNGLAVEAIQHFSPQPCGSCPQRYFALIESVVLGGFILTAFGILLVLMPQRLGKRWRESDQMNSSNYGATEECENVVRECTAVPCANVIHDDDDDDDGVIVKPRRHRSLTSSTDLDPVEATLCSRSMLPPPSSSMAYT